MGNNAVGRLIVGLKPKLALYPFRVRANHHLKWWFVIMEVLIWITNVDKLPG